MHWIIVNVDKVKIKNNILIAYVCYYYALKQFMC